LVGSKEFLKRPKTRLKLPDKAVNNKNLISNPELALMIIQFGRYNSVFAYS